MFDVIATDVFVSKGYKNEAAVRYSDNATSVRFRIGKKVYDPHAENNTRWNNIAVKAFGAECDKIKKMKLKEGSHIHLFGRLDTEEWADKETGELKSQWVIIVDKIEYGYSGSGKGKDNQDDGFQNPNGEMQQPAMQGADPAMMQAYQMAQQQMPPNGQQQAMPQQGVPQGQYAAQQQMAPQSAQQMQTQNPMTQPNFTGYEAYGGQQFFQHG